MWIWPVGAALGFAAATSAWAAELPSAQASVWTLQDIVEAPRVVATAITADGRFGLAIVRQDHMADNQRDSRLVRIDTLTGQQVVLLKSAWLSDLAAIPGSTDWSLLADEGQGVQLYRMTLDGRLTPIVVSQTVVTIGSDDATAISRSAFETDQRFGVLGYGWAPDGRRLWYATASVVASTPSTVTVIDVPAPAPLHAQSNVSELHVTDLAGNDRALASVRGGPPPNPDIAFASTAAHWVASGQTKGGDDLIYVAPKDAGNPASPRVTWRFDPIRGRTAPDDARSGRATAVGIPGPHGGQLGTPWRQGARHLVETLSDGRTTDLGAVTFQLNTSWSKGLWTLPDHTIIVGVRDDVDNLRSNLARISPTGVASELEPDVSLTHCAVSEAAERGICVREGLAVPPSIVAIDAKAWTQTPLVTLDLHYAAIAPLRVEPRGWRLGQLRTQGFVVYPRGYKPGTRYPAIVLSHGRDGDNTFVSWAFQWNYPAQVWAERGYVVVIINDIPVDNDQMRETAYREWATGTGGLPPKKVQQLIWLDQVRMYRHVLKALSREGLIDAAHVAIAGYSRGSQMVNVAITQTHLFAAASTGDGDYLNPSGFWLPGNEIAYKAIFGGDPYRADLRSSWRRLSPPFRADKVTTPTLFQDSDYYDYAGKTEFYRTLRARNVPAEFVLFTHETHLLHVPRHRMTAMVQNLDWFDFWLKGYEDPDPAKAAQYARWRSMRTAARTR